jgi:hypothetical protein
MAPAVDDDIIMSECVASLNQFMEYQTLASKLDVYLPTSKVPEDSSGSTS